MSYDFFVKENESKIDDNVNFILKFKGSVCVKDKYLNIQKNLGNKETFFKTIAKKKSAFAIQSLSNTPSCSQESKNQGIFYTNDLQIPIRCQERIDLSERTGKFNPHGRNCTVTAKFSIN